MLKWLPSSSDSSPPWCPRLSRAESAAGHTPLQSHSRYKRSRYPRPGFREPRSGHRQCTAPLRRPTWLRSARSPRRESSAHTFRARRCSTTYVPSTQSPSGGRRYSEVGSVMPCRQGHPSPPSRTGRSTFAESGSPLHRLVSPVRERALMQQIVADMAQHQRLPLHGGHHLLNALCRRDPSAFAHDGLQRIPRPSRSTRIVGH